MAGKKPYTKNVYVETPIQILTELRPWQASIVEIATGEIDPRTVYWIYDPNGNTGKTQLCKYMVVKHDAMVATNGSIRDILYMIAERKNLKE